jgi:hypothetical protein
MLKAPLFMLCQFRFHRLSSSSALAENMDHWRVAKKECGCFGAYELVPCTASTSVKTGFSIRKPE